MPKQPNIYTYLDYRTYLRDLYEARKQTKRGFSYRSFARTAGLSSENHLWQVINGRRKLSGATIIKFAKGFGLKKHETAYFEHLVHFNQAKTTEEKNHHYRKLASSKRYIEVRHLERDQFEYLSKWYYAVIRELVLLPDFCEEPAWIAARLAPVISEREAAEALELLFRLGLLGRDADGRVVQTERHVTSGEEVASLAATNFHKQMIDRAAAAVEGTRPEHRELSALTVAIPKAKIAQVKERIRQVRRELHEMMATDDGADVVYQLNLQFFNVSEVAGETI